jgi:hypothetical protein
VREVRIAPGKLAGEHDYDRGEHPVRLLGTEDSRSAQCDLPQVRPHALHVRQKAGTRVQRGPRSCGQRHSLRARLVQEQFVQLRLGPAGGDVHAQRRAHLSDHAVEPGRPLRVAERDERRIHLPRVADLAVDDRARALPERRLHAS